MSVLHNSYVEATRKIRQRLGDANVGRFEFMIKAEGRTETGEDNVKIEYHLREDYDHWVVGDSVDAVVEEFLRRKGWNKEHAPLRLA